MKHWIPALALACVSAAASAAPVYRCGGGTYSQTPCPGGTVVDATDPRSAAQRAEARRVAAEERRRARQMERERIAQEKRSRKQAALASLGPESAASAPADSASKPAAQRKGKRRPETQGQDFTAVVPKSPKP
jgi:hypothetical protein